MVKRQQCFCGFELDLQIKVTVRNIFRVNYLDWAVKCINKYDGGQSGLSCILDVKELDINLPYN